MEELFLSAIECTWG